MRGRLRSCAVRIHCLRSQSTTSVKETAKDSAAVPCNSSSRNAAPFAMPHHLLRDGGRKESNDAV